MAEMRIGDNVIQLKAVKKTCGMEGYGFTANIYINKKRLVHMQTMVMVLWAIVYLIVKI